MKRSYHVDLCGSRISLDVDNGSVQPIGPHANAPLGVRRIGENRYVVLFKDGVVPVAIIRSGQGYDVQAVGVRWFATVEDERDSLRAQFQSKAGGVKVQDLRAPMPALVSRVHVEPGSEVKQGSTLLVLEAMKMENELKAPRDAVIEKVLVKPGTTVEKDQVLVSLR